MTTPKPQPTHIENLAAKLDGYDEARSLEVDAVTMLEVGDQLAQAVRELLWEIEHIKRGGEPTDRMN